MTLLVLSTPPATVLRIELAADKTARALERGGAFYAVKQPVVDVERAMETTLSDRWWPTFPFPDAVAAQREANWKSEA